MCGLNLLYLVYLEFSVRRVLACLNLVAKKKIILLFTG